MLKWLRRSDAQKRVAVIEALPVEGRRSVVLVRRDNIEHLVLVGGRNDLVIEANIIRRPAPNQARRPSPERQRLPSPGAPTREPLAEPSPNSLEYNLEELTRQLEAELRRSPPQPLRTAPRSSAQRDATSVDVEAGSRPGFDAKAEPKDEPKDEPKLQDENRPDSKSPDEPPRPEHEGEVQQAEPQDTDEAAQPRAANELART
jgi:hypothetical protein